MNKNLDEIKEYFINNRIEQEKLNLLKESLLYLIKNGYPYENIEFFIKQYYHHQSYQLQNNNNIDNKESELLFCSIEYNNFKIAKLLLKYETIIINNNNSSNNILNYLCVNNKLNLENLLFILNISKTTNLITSEVLCNIINNKNITLLKRIFNYKYFDIDFIKNILNIYRNKIKLSRVEFEKLIYSNKGLIKVNEKTIDGNYSLLTAINENVYIVKLLIDYANENNIILELNEKNEFGDFPLLMAINKYNIEMVKLLIDYANEKNIILELNEKDIDGNYPLLNAINNNNIETIKLLMDYAN
eukprot:jgi/Orpsp1_1/1186039/evm.model.c7180000096583.2